MSAPTEEVLNLQRAEEVRERILASKSDGPRVIPKPVPPPSEPTAEDRRLAYQSAEKFVRATGRRVVGTSEDTLRRELKCRGGGQWLTNDDVDQLIALAKRLGASRETTEYVDRRAKATRYVDTVGRALDRAVLAEMLETKFGLNEQDVSSLARRARGEL